MVDTTITTTMKDLVSRSPFMDSTGRFYVSSKVSHAIALDRGTGDIINVVNHDGNNQHHSDHDNNTEEGEGDNEERDVIWLGRVDYSVTIHDARTGEVDVQFSTSEVLGLDDMIGLERDNHGSTAGGFKNNMNDNESGQGNDPRYNRSPSPFLTLQSRDGNIENQQDTDGSYLSSKVVTTPGGKVALHDPNSGEILWIAEDALKTPVAFAVESSTGLSLGVHVIPDAPSSNQFSEEYLSSEFEKELSDGFLGSGGIGVGDDKNNHDMGDTVFGALESEQLFALPLGHYSRSNPRALGSLPHIPRISSSTVGAPKYEVAKLPHVSNPADWRHGTERQNNAIAIKKQFCDPTSGNFPQCILDTYGRSDDNWFFDGNQFPALSSIDPDFESFQRQNYQRSSKNEYYFYIKLMTSWIPPAVALIFVLSFELGRRERLRSEAAKVQDNLEDKDSKREADQSLVNISEGVIDVSDEVLGYGGHGTVVYKGKLEGRYVAVKRMLKAYHLSANREISLLIESDGHPNVVRYFLKELRGDFVYLALELCDMNLQDLINVLKKHRMKVTPFVKKNGNSKTNTIDMATKKLLFEIASGVKHIHSLRIVHRDLKPANILLARKNRIMKDEDENENGFYDTFKSQGFVVKISDMGLGKQLVGQSSFGFSTMNNSIGISVSKNDGSTIAGAGPGSVGWQAPEVMAHRLSPESPLLHDESNDPETMSEASPIDASLNGRTSRSVDIFSLGCIFYCTVLPGSHPFGEWYEREANIMKNCPSTKALGDITVDATDLILSMIHRNPRIRPTAMQVCNHPFFWSPFKRLTFLCDLSDRLETNVDIDTSAKKLDPFVIERNATSIVGTAWDTKLHPGLFNNVSKFRSYDPSSVRDCLRLVRNKSHHFDELSNEVKDNIASNKEELLNYFESIFPFLLMHCYHTCREHLNLDDTLVTKYDIPCKISMTTVEDKRNVEDNGTDKTISPLTDSQCGQPDVLHIWENSSAASSYNCRGWMRSENEWIRRTGINVKKRNINLTKCAEDAKFRTRLCNHWDQSQGTCCPMSRKHKCDFAHGPVQLRVKEGKRNRWGKLVDKKGNNSNPQASGGEDTYGAARSIETARKGEGKWNTDSKGKKGKKKSSKKK